jgi:hypothetical protein
LNVREKIDVDRSFGGAQKTALAHPYRRRARDHHDDRLQSNAEEIHWNELALRMTLGAVFQMTLGAVFQMTLGAVFQMTLGAVFQMTLGAVFQMPESPLLLVLGA